MPELPEVETVRRDLARLLVGRTLHAVTVSRDDVVIGSGRRKLARELTGRTVEAVDRRGKNLLVRLTGGFVLLVHLGMTGRFYVCDADEPLAEHTHLVADLSDGRRLIFRDPRRFGHLEHVRCEKLDGCRTLCNVGVDAMSAQFTARALAEILAGRSALVKAALLDQTRVAGLGNIYACEAMYRAGISPLARCHELSEEHVAALHRAIRGVLTEAIEHGGTTIADYVSGAGVPGEFQTRLRVYGREGERCRARGCGGVIERLVQSNRSTYYCPKCQPARGVGAIEAE